MRRSTLWLALALGVALPAAAEIAPEYYARDQLSAPEALTIKVLEVDSSVCWFNLCDGWDISAEVEVVSVERSATGLAPGRRLRVEYRRTNPSGGWAGPRPIDRLVEGQVVPAFLRKAGAVYRPAARGASFEPQIALPGGLEGPR